MEKHAGWRKIKVEGGYLHFTAAHFITFGRKCENLHGHNYAVEVELEGVSGEDQLVFDFSVLKHLTRDVCRSLHQHFLLPLRNPHLKITELTDGWEIYFGEKRYVFPREDVLALPFENSTAECLSEYICHALREKLAAYPIANLQTITVGVAEAPTQIAWYQEAFV
jgi:6-pyruvoyl tetrahydropterin synthase/QueD family protein